jgi:hypothetical protein
MVKKSFLIALLAALSILGGSTIAVALPIDTGYDYSVYNPYVTPTTTISTTHDMYWINIASYPTLPVSTSFVQKNSGIFVPPIPSNSKWIGPRNTAASATGTSPTNPSYTTFKKCFCLEPNFNRAQLLNLSVMNDNSIEIWLNTVTNVLFGPAVGSATSPTTIPNTAAHLGVLHAGTNCIYVLLEDTGGNMAFDLAGDFTANGLDPYAASGVDQKFPCSCDRRPGPTIASDEDRQAVSAIVKIAETRRQARMAR